MSSDITHILRDWPYAPDRVIARMIEGADGQPKVQLRLDMGLIQMEADGRPDGTKPEGFPTLLALHQHRLQRYEHESESSAGYVIGPEDCRALRSEAVQFYHRYVALHAMGDMDRVIRDTLHNLSLLDLCRDYAAQPMDRVAMEEFRPSIITMRTRAQAEIAIRQEQPRSALEVLESGLREIQAVYDEAGQGDRFKDSNEAQLLFSMRDLLIPKLPASQQVELRERLKAALAAENYELAAILRDELRLLDDTRKPPPGDI